MKFQHTARALASLFSLTSTGRKSRQRGLRARRLAFEKCEGRELLTACAGPATISGMKVNDLTGNGFTVDDVPLGGVSIEMWRDGGDGAFNFVDDALSQTMLSANGTGAFQFTNVQAGRYFIRETVPLGFVQTAGPGFYTIDVVGNCVFSGTPVLVDDFNLPNPGQSWFINAFNPNPTLIKNTVAGTLGGQRDLLIDVLGVATPLSASGTVGFSGGVGAFSFGSGTQIPPTRAILQYDGPDADVVGPPASLINAQGLTQNLVGADGNNGLRFDYRSVQVGGVATQLEVRVRMTGPGGATATFTGTVTENAAAFTDFIPFSSFTTAGGFAFSNVTSIEVEFNQIGALDVDFIVDQITAAKNVNTGFNFGNFNQNRASIAGFVYADVNDNGVKDAAESPIPGVQITLMNLQTGALLNTTTDATGFYKFDSLPQGLYKITEAQPATYIDGKDTLGQNGPNAGGVTSNDMFTQINLQAGQNGVNNNFGELGLQPTVISKRSLIAPAVQPVPAPVPAPAPAPAPAPVQTTVPLVTSINTIWSRSRRRR